MQNNLRRRLAYLKESVIGGGKIRESILIRLLGRYYAGKFRREWVLGSEEPHFFSQRIGLFAFAFGESGSGPYGFTRGFLSAEVLRDGDRLLDIGCGDGFFTKRFFSARCAHIDAIDIEPSAIAEAQAVNNSPKINYQILDAVNQPFPGDQYDVIVWDGALGHFSADTTHRMLEKIQKHLKADGVFVGSESLGIEGSDHLQYFNSLDDLQKIFEPYFRHVELRAVAYKIGDGFLRHEAFWRCANDQERLQDCHWQVSSREREISRRHE
jgi:2-polyprenyl-3-methyl-5-hydroxy-6-metoxy-1,4-benzoquinol methylase